MAGFAWVTLATNDSYSLGALVLAHSLRRVGSKHDLAVLVTPGVTGAMREKLASVFSLVQEVNVLDSKDEANLALLARPELGITFTKLHCWRLTQYEKCVFVDADTLVIRNCDELFEREELSAAPDVGWPDCFNSGVFVFKPSQQTFASITSFAATKGSFDGGDQGLLNQYFSDWAHKDISKHLPFIYNMCSTATYSYLPAFKQFGEDVRIIHFIGITKPWLQYFDTVTGQVQPAPGSNHLQPLLQLWWHIFCENVHPQLSPVMAGIAGALAKITLGEARSPEQVAFEEHMRKQSWEQGQIDYMGRDSFDNIWKKISETLGVQTQRQPSPPKTVPKPEESKADVATPVATDDQPTAKKSEAAVPAEPREKAEQDLTRDLAPGEAKVAPQIAQLEPEKIIVESAIPAETPIGEAAVTPVALAVIESPVPAAKEPEKSARNDDESPTTTTTLDSTIVRAAEILLRDVQVAEAARTDLPKIPETPAAAATENPPAEPKPADSEKDVEPEEIKSTETSSPIVAESQVPIQVAESVLEAEVKESVTEEMRPVTEEAISSISVASQESVPAVLATVMQAAVGPSPPPSASTPNGAAVLDPISEIGNEIDAQNRAAPIASAIVAAAVGPREVVTTARTEETPPTAAQPTQDVAQEATTPAPISAEIVRETEPKLPASETKELKVSAVEAQEAPAQAPQTSTSSAQLSEKSEAPGTPAEAEKCILIAAEPTKKSEEAELPVKSKESSSPPETAAKAEQPISSPAPLVARSDETKVPAKIDEPASPATEKLAEVQPTKSVESACPIKSTSAVVDVKPAATKKQVPKDEPKDPEVTEDLASQSESSEESPVRPARTKDQQQIPGTPIVTEATPPTSPPIGAVETFAEQPTTTTTTKTTRKVVKKVVKKTTSTEAKATEGPEGAEGEAKKPTKKIVKKVTKKTKEDDGAAGAEASGAAEKPKKIVKVTKKTTKSGPTLEADAPTPETPPPGAPEVPVPPKRKLKTAGKSTPAKTEPEP